MHLPQLRQVLLSNLLVVQLRRKIFKHYITILFDFLLYTFAFILEFKFEYLQFLLLFLIHTRLELAQHTFSVFQYLVLHRLSAVLLLSCFLLLLSYHPVVVSVVQVL